MKPHEPQWASAAVVATAAFLLLAFAAGLYIQLGILERLKLAVLSSMENVSVRDLATSGLLRAALRAMTPVDWTVAGASLALLAAFVFLQARFGTFSDFLRLLFGKEWRVLAFLGFLSILAFKPILSPGAPYFLDAPAHVSRAWFSYVNLVQGYPFPFFTNYYHNGFALFSHYGWLPPYVTALVNLVLGNINLSSKVVVFLLSIGDAFLFYAVGRRIFASRRAGLLLAVIFCTSNLYLFDILWGGALFYPWVFLGLGVMILGFEEWLAGARSVYVAALVTALGAAILIDTHLGYASQSLLFFAVYALARTLLFHPGRFRAFLGYGAISLAMGAVLGAFVFLPTYFDIRDVNFYKAFPFSDPSTYEFWRMPLWQFLVPRPFFASLTFGYVGLGLAGAAAVLTVRFLRRPHRWLILSLVLLAFCLLVIGYARNAYLVVVALAFLVTGGYALLLGKSDGRLGALAFLLLALICDALLFNNFNTFDTRGGMEKAVYDRLEQQPDGTRFGVVIANTLHTGNDTGNDVFVSPWLKVVGHVILQPNAIMLEANKQAIYQYGFTSDLLVPDIRRGRLSPETVEGLDLIGVKYITFHNIFQYFVPTMQPQEGVRVRPDGPWLELPLTSPLLYAPAAVNVRDLEATWPDLGKQREFETDNLSHARAPFRPRPVADAYLKAVLGATGLDPSTANARQFLLRGTAEGGTLGDGGPAHVTVQRYYVDSQRVEVSFTVDRKGYVAVPFGYFWYQRVLLDGRRVAFLPTVENTICVRIDAPGAHTLSIGPAISPARRIGAIVSSVGLAILLALLLFPLLRRGPPMSRTGA